VFFGQYNGNAHLFVCLFIVVTWKMLGVIGEGGVKEGILYPSATIDLHISIRH